METNEKKLKECQELIHKINTTFNIKIDSDKKDVSIVWFRFYIIDKFKDEALRVSYVPLNKHHATISYIRKQLPKLKHKTEYKDIISVIESCNIDFYKAFLDKFVKKRYEKKENIEQETKNKKLQMPINQAMALLRKKPKSLLWNKKISDWNYFDWKELNTY